MSSKTCCASWSILNCNRYAATSPYAPLPTQKLYNNFIDQLGDEKTDILKCINFRKDKENFMNKINSCNKMIEDENNLADNYKMELDKR